MLYLKANVRQFRDVAVHTTLGWYLHRISIEKERIKPSKKCVCNPGSVFNFDFQDKILHAWDFKYYNFDPAVTYT